MKQCPNCHELIGENASHCFQCGKEIVPIRYICILCGKPLTFASSQCTCGGQATSIHENPNTPVSLPDKRLSWLFSKKNRNKKIAILTVLVVCLILYFIMFFTKGLVYENVFMTKKMNGATAIYTGNHYSGAMEITVSGLKDIDASSEVVLKLPGNIYEEYTVSYDNPSNWSSSRIKIMDNTDLLFEGFYRDSQFGILFDGNGDMISPDFVITYNNGSPFTSDYKTPLYKIVELSLSESDKVRGNYYILLMALYILVFTAIDYIFPLFYFQLRHFLSVNNPEPSDFYLSMQKLSWIVLPVIGVILMLVALLQIE